MSDPEVYRRLAALERWRDDMASVERPRTIAARYATDAGQSIPNAAATIVNFEDVSFDPDSLVTTGAAWVFTAPVAGIYHVDTALLFDATTAWADGEVAMVNLLKNGVIISVLYRRDNNASTASTFVWAGGSDLVACNAGNTLSIEVTQTSGGALPLFNDANYNYVAISLVH